MDGIQKLFSNIYFNELDLSNNYQLLHQRNNVYYLLSGLAFITADVTIKDDDGNTSSTYSLHQRINTPGDYIFLEDVFFEDKISNGGLNRIVNMRATLSEGAKVSAAIAKSSLEQAAHSEPYLKYIYINQVKESLKLEGMLNAAENLKRTHKKLTINCLNKIYSADESPTSISLPTVSKIHVFATYFKNNFPLELFHRNELPKVKMPFVYAIGNSTCETFSRSYSYLKRIGFLPKKDSFMDILVGLKENLYDFDKARAFFSLLQSEFELSIINKYGPDKCADLPKELALKDLYNYGTHRDL